MKKQFEVVIIDANGCATNELYTCSDITMLFIIINKELANKILDYEIKKIVIEEIK